MFDYSVYSWPSFNQDWNQAMVGPCKDQVRTMLGPGKDPDLDQELDKNDALNISNLNLKRFKTLPLREDGEYKIIFRIPPRM